MERYKFCTLPYVDFLNSIPSLRAKKMRKEGFTVVTVLIICTELEI